MFEFGRLEDILRIFQNWRKISQEMNVWGSDSDRSYIQN